MQDPLDSVDYDPIDHLNALFAHPSTLSSVPATSQALHNHVSELDDEVAKLVATQVNTNDASVQGIETAKRELVELFKGIEGVRERAIRTEMAITEMTADIKRLDGTKRNLTVSMTALKRLQMLTTAYEQLRALCKTRQYRECAQLLQAVIQLMAHFRSYRSIDQIAILSRNVADLQRELLEQVCEDFEIIFAKGEVASKKAMLGEGCLVMDSLGNGARSRLITWYCNTQLREYRQVFKGNDEAGSLDNISRRYAWLKRILKIYDDEHSAIFPASWKASEVLAKSFCDGTRDDFKSILSKSMRRIDGKSLDVNLLLSCLQETLDFEQWLEKRFANDQRVSIDTMSSKDEKSLIFGKAVSEAFEPYLSVWIESQDKQLAGMVRKYRANPGLSAEDEFSPSSVLPSSIELFHFYRLTLAQCAKLSTGSKLLDLSRTFSKYLDEYATDVLMHFVPEKQIPSIGGPSLQDIAVILNTADYCQTTTAQLEERIKSKIDDEEKPKVDFEKQQDAFLGVAGATIRLLVKRVEADCESSWREMRNISWNRLENVGDQSSYVAELVKAVRKRAEEVLKVLTKEQYVRAFCDKLVESLMNTFIGNIILCKPISSVGAEQMLLDSYVLKKGFEDLPILISEPGATPSSGYLKHLTRTFRKSDSLLKTLQVQSNPPEALVQAYFIHIADKSEANFRKVLELKGISKRSEQAQLVELFHAHMPLSSSTRGGGAGSGYGETELVEASSVLSPLLVQGAGTLSGGGSLSSGMGGMGIGSINIVGGGVGGGLGSAGLSNSFNKFDPGAFGNALISAARDGVDRFQSSGSGGGDGASGSTGLGIMVGGGGGDERSPSADLSGITPNSGNNTNNNDISLTSTNSSTSTLPTNTTSNAININSITSTTTTSISNNNILNNNGAPNNTNNTSTSQDDPASSTTTGPATTTTERTLDFNTLNQLTGENLRSIGRFFRRETTGRFGGSGSGSGSGSPAAGANAGAGGGAGGSTTGGR